MQTQDQHTDTEEFMLKRTRYRLSYCLISIILIAGNAYAGKWPIEIFERMDGKKIVVFLQDKDISDSPEWKPYENSPQLTIEEALRHLRSWLDNQGKINMVVKEIDLKRIHGHEMENRWYYLVQLHDANSKKETDYAAVLFNGKVAPAIAEPSSIK